MIGNFFHIPKIKKFNIPSRFHNPGQDERDERERRMKEELGIKEEIKDTGKPHRANIKGQFRYAMRQSSKSAENARRSSNTRLIILILILSVIAYLLFYSNFSF
ncbi:hypothetical protein MNBD_BACTEROID01-1690 [hydrothermal vent metagenome]|uniref:Uncharacterized protein n=1 Tax=hydrothermal vent metagenome TaxID=652676 RepID=A0A3B0U5D5_9ZZZZ